jgi:hypothetical protein
LPVVVGLPCLLVPHQTDPGKLKPQHSWFSVIKLLSTLIQVI